MPTLRGALHLLSLVNGAVRGDRLAKRKLAWRFLAGEAEHLGFERGGIHWSGPVSSVIIEELFTSGQYQQQQIQPLMRFLEKHRRSWSSSSVIVNVGANVGDSAVVLAMETGKRVIACEPVPTAFRFLTENVRANGLDGRVSCHQVAIGTFRGPIEMISPSDSAQAEVRTDGRQGFGVSPTTATLACPATMITLEDVLQIEAVVCAQVGLVWSDTQGYESEIVLSGTRLWETGVPLWVELWPTGLEAHGGTARFVDLCSRSFKSFLTDREMGEETPEPQDIDRLPAFAELVSRGPVLFRDVLLLP